MTIEDIKKLDDKDIVPEVSGTLVAVYERKTGKGANGDWSLQNCELEDDSGRMKLLLSNRPEMQRENKGRNVVIRCHKGDKGKSGIYAADNTYNGVTKRLIRVTSTGIVLFDTEGAESRDGSASDQQTVKEFKEHIGAVVNSNGGGTPRVFGATVGMAINNAVGIILAACEGEGIAYCKSEGIAYYKSPEFSSDLHQIASALVRVSQQMESGDLWVAPAAPIAKDNVVEAAKDLFQEVTDVHGRTEDESQEEEWK